MRKSFVLGGVVLSRVRREENLACGPVPSRLGDLTN